MPQLTVRVQRSEYVKEHVQYDLWVRGEVAGTQLKRCYSYTDEDRCGAGGYGAVYRAIWTDSSDHQHPIAVKVLHGKYEASAPPDKEAEYFNRMYPLDREVYPFSTFTYQVTVSGDGEKPQKRTYIFMSHLSGFSLAVPDLAFLLSEYSLHARLLMLYGFANRLARLHGSAPHGRGILIHRDIKTKNVIFDPSKKALSLIDYGIVSYIPPEQIAQVLSTGNRLGGYVPIEVIRDPDNPDCGSKYCPKTDVAMSLWVVLLMLGVTCPNKERQEKTQAVRGLYDRWKEQRDFARRMSASRKDTGLMKTQSSLGASTRASVQDAERQYLLAARDQARTPYNYDGMMPFPSSKEHPIQTFVQTFFDRMQSSCPERRPTSLEMASFFGRLTEYYHEPRLGDPDQLAKALFCLAVGVSESELMSMQKPKGIISESLVNSGLLSRDSRHVLREFCCGLRR